MAIFLENTSILDAVVLSPAFRHAQKKTRARVFYFCVAHSERGTFLLDSYEIVVRHFTIFAKNQLSATQPRTGIRKIQQLESCRSWLFF